MSDFTLHQLTADSLMAQTGALRALARGLVRGTEDVDLDVVQDAYVVALQREAAAAESRSAEAAPSSAWFGGVVRRLELHGQRTTARRRLLDADPELDPDDSAFQRRLGFG